MRTLSRRGTLTGLGAAASPRPRTGKAAGTVKVWWTQGYNQAEDQALRDMVAIYEKESGNKIDLQIVPGPDLIIKLTAASQSGNVPDVVQAVTGGTFYQPRAVWNDEILEIGDVVATRENAFLPAALNACRYYNKVTKSRGAISMALERLTAPYKKGYVPAGAINWGDVDNNNNAFYAKQVVMTPNATISIAVAQAEKKDQYYHDIITTGIPAGNDGKPVPGILDVTSAFIPKAAKNIDGGKSFLKWFIRPSSLNAYLKQARGRWLPVMPAMLKEDPYWLDPNDPHRPVAAKYALILPSIPQFQTFTPAYAQVVSEQLWAAAEANITQKNMTPDQATEIVVKRFKDIFEQFPMG